jgi:hypothetical protein
MVPQAWQIQTRHILLPKEGCAPDECEDAVGLDAVSLRFALADGATEAFDSRAWARLLAEGWVEAEPPPISVEQFGHWAAAQGERLRASWDGRHLPWYAEEKRRAGSFAAFVGLRLRESGRTLRWEAVALGDSCLVQRRAGALLAAMPVSDYRAFNPSPALVPSHEPLLGAALARAVTRAGTAERGDVFLLLSDAAAAWYLELFERGHPSVAEFDSLLAASQNEALARLLRQERQAKRMRDDDVAAVRVAVH